MGKKKAKPVKPDSHTSNPNPKSKKKSKDSTFGFLKALDKVLLPRPLIDGESRAEYEAFYKSCLRAVRPKDAIEEVWLRDFVDHWWEAQRLSRMKITLIQATRKEAVKKILTEYGDREDILDGREWLNAGPISQAWCRSEEEATDYVNALLEECDLDYDTIMATAVSIMLDKLERTDKLIASHDYRRDAAIRELEKRRDILAKRAREFTDAVFTDVDIEELESAE